MSVPVIHESEMEELDLPGRSLRWIIGNGGIDAQGCSACVITLAPGAKVRPAHSHPLGEEVIYILSGEGRVLVDGDTAFVRAGSTALFPTGAVHMLENRGSEEMKVVCFFAPGTSLENYQMHEGVEFPQ